MRDVFQDASSVWERVSHFAAEIRESDFMAKMTRHLDQPGGHGLMGALDCATLYGLTRWRRPTVVAETGGYLGMSSGFILKALAEEGLAEAKLFSLEMAEDCDHGALIPGELRSQFMPMQGEWKTSSNATSCLRGSTCSCTIVRIAIGTCFGNFANSGIEWTMVDCWYRMTSISIPPSPHSSPRPRPVTKMGLWTKSGRPTTSGAAEDTSVS